MRVVRPEVDRFWGLVRKEQFCWHWIGAKQRTGYGLFRVRGQMTKELAHRTAYRLTYGAPESSSDVMHICDNVSCVNPSHLRLGTHADNMKDKAVKGRAAKKLSAGEVRKIVCMRNSGAKLRDICLEFSISKGYASALCAGKHWKYLQEMCA